MLSNLGISISNTRIPLCTFGIKVLNYQQGMLGTPLYPLPNITVPSKNLPSGARLVHVSIAVVSVLLFFTVMLSKSTERSEKLCSARQYEARQALLRIPSITTAVIVCIYPTLLLTVWNRSTTYPLAVCIIAETRSCSCLKTGPKA